MSTRDEYIKLHTAIGLISNDYSIMNDEIDSHISSIFDFYVNSIKDIDNKQFELLKDTDEIICTLLNRLENQYDLFEIAGQRYIRRARNVYMPSEHDMMSFAHIVSHIDDDDNITDINRLSMKSATLLNELCIAIVAKTNIQIVFDFVDMVEPSITSHIDNDCFEGEEIRSLWVTSIIQVTRISALSQVLSSTLESLSRIVKYFNEM